MKEISPQMKNTIRDLVNSEGVKFPVTEYLLTFKCTRCGQTWSQMSLTKDDTVECRFGCSNPSFWRVIRGILKREEAYGCGKLIKSEKFQTHL